MTPPTFGFKGLPRAASPLAYGSCLCVREVFLIFADESAHLDPQSQFALPLLPAGGEGVGRASQGLWGGEGEMTQRGGGPQGSTVLERGSTGEREGKGTKEDGETALRAVLTVSRDGAGAVAQQAKGPHRTWTPVLVPAAPIPI